MKYNNIPVMKKLISYIFPIYNEAGNIDLLYKTIDKITSKVADRYDFEFIFINDASRDKSMELLRDLAEHDDRVVVLDFARNYGHQIAVTAGIDHARGDAVIIMDSDMQDPPRVSLELIEKWEQGYEVVYAQRRTRKDGFFKKLTASMFYKILHKLSDIDIPVNTGDFRLIDRQVADELKKYREHDRFLRGMISYIGFKQTGVLFDRDERHAGETGYPLRKMIKLAVDGVLGFSTTPLKLINRLGYIMSGLSLLGILYVLWVKLFNPATAVSGWSFTVIIIFLIGGIQLMVLGILGEYIGRIYTEAQGRPLYAVRRIYKHPQAKAGKVTATSKNSTK